MNNDEVLLKQLLTAINQVSDAVVIISPENIVLHINEPFHRLFPASQKSNLLENGSITVKVRLPQGAISTEGLLYL